jgi:magnesium-transporting ATPase (P-type)
MMSPHTVFAVSSSNEVCSSASGAVADTAAISDLLRTAALCCDAHLVPPHENHKRCEAIGDPTEAAILVAAAKMGLSREALRERHGKGPVEVTTEEVCETLGAICERSASGAGLSA